MIGNKGRRLGLAVALAIGAGSMAAGATGAATGGPVAAADVVARVDPMIGTGAATGTVGEINNFPGPSMPFGMVQLSPDTPSSYAGYRYSDDRIRGFSLTHASAGCSVFGDVPILPIIGPVGDKPWERSERFSHADEHAEVGRYRVRFLESGITTELSAATRAGALRFAFPAAGAAHVLIDAGGSLAKVADAQVRVVGSRTVVGSVTSGRFCGKGDRHTIHYAIEFDHDFQDVGVWQGGVVKPGVREAAGQNAGAWLGFAPGATVKVKAALSYVDLAGAQANLRAEMPDWDFDRVRYANRAAGRARLSKIAVRTSDGRDLTMFTTSLYQSLLHPNTFNDADGRYLGVDGRVRRVRPGHTYYTNVSDWDTYRSLGALHALLAPGRASDIAQSLVDMAAQGGQLPRWPLANRYTGQMTGDSSVSLIASMAAFGARDFDRKAALAFMVKGATTAPSASGGYVERPGVDVYQRLRYGPQTPAFKGDHRIVGASMTLEWSIADFAISRFAQGLGRKDVARRFLERSTYWRNVFDPERRIMSARSETGAFIPGAPGDGFGQPGFAEGNDEQYTWMVPQDVAGLTNALGGRAAAADRLDAFVSELNAGPNRRRLWIGNEPNFGVPWLYDYLGRPWRTSELVDRIIATLFEPGPNGKPGNDDLGAQAGWYVWAAMGLYPVTPGTDLLALNTPRFDEVRIDLGKGRALDLRAPGAAGHRYVTGMRVDGRAWDHTYLPGGLIRRGGVIDLTLSSKRQGAWGEAPDASPASFEP